MSETPREIVALEAARSALASALAGSAHWVRAVRAVLPIARALHERRRIPEHTFLLMRGFESETDHWPAGDDRSNYSGEYLAELDAAVAEYTERRRSELEEASREVIRAIDRTMGV